MKKKMMKTLAVALLASLLMAMVGCEQSAASSGTSVSEEEEYVRDDASEWDSEEGFGEDETIEPDEEPYFFEPDYYPEPMDDESRLAALIVDEADARNEKLGYYIIRDGKWYSLNKVPLETSQLYDFGVKHVDFISKFAMLYASENSNSYISMGQVPIMTLRPGDKFIGIGEKTLRLTEVDFVGYTINLVSSTEGIRSGEHFLHEDIWSEKIDLPGNDFEVRDWNDDIVENYRDLVFGEIYTVSWFDRTNYKEYRLLAENSFYKEPNNAREYELHGELSRESYALYDLSEVPAGTYRFWSQGFACIINIE